MKQLPTAKEFISQYELGNTGKVDIEDAQEALIKFAKLHIEAALESASISFSFEISIDENTFDKMGVMYLSEESECDIKQSILNAYPLDNIK